MFGVLPELKCSSELVAKWPSLIEQIGAEVHREPLRLAGSRQTIDESVTVRCGNEEFDFAIGKTPSDEAEGLDGSIMLLGPFGSYDFQTWLGARIARIFLACGARSRWGSGGQIFCQKLYLARSVYAATTNPFEAMIKESGIASKGGVIKPAGADCWSIELRKSRLLLYTGPAFDFSENRRGSYWAIDYARGLLGFSPKTLEIVEEIRSQFERAEAVLLLERRSYGRWPTR